GCGYGNHRHVTPAGGSVDTNRARVEQRQTRMRIAAAKSTARNHMLRAARATNARVNLLGAVKRDVAENFAGGVPANWRQTTYEDKVSQWMWGRLSDLGVYENRDAFRRMTFAERTELFAGFGDRPFGVNCQDFGMGLLGSLGNHICEHPQGWGQVVTGLQVVATVASSVAGGAAAGRLGTVIGRAAAGTFTAGTIDAGAQQLFTGDVNWTLALGSGLLGGLGAAAPPLRVGGATAPQATGRQLVVGGGRAADMPATPGISLNTNPAARPHVVGDIANAPFRSGSFSSVYFERVPFSSFTGRNIGALDESARLLRPGGELIMQTGPAAPAAEIMGRLEQLGFTNIWKTEPSYLEITATWGGL
ncbi:MAG TPA: hypothetical protein VIQ02_20405, partial [Jiangellaceae bacterium]